MRSLPTVEVSPREVRWLIEEKYGGAKNHPELRRDIKRLERGGHIAYVIGFADFLGARIDLSVRPLIPRSETEFWVSQAIKELAPEKTIRCLDIFAGSGCVGIAVLRHLPRSRMDFADISSRALRQIRKNIGLNAIDAARARVFGSDVFSAVDGVYDAIFANPPYLDAKKLNPAARAALKNEPPKALFAGRGGLLYLERVIRAAPRYLSPGGRLFVEFDGRQKDEVEKFARLSRFSSFEARRDQYGAWRWARLSTAG